MSNAVLVEEVGSVIIVRFNRPEIRSPLSVAVIEQLARIVGEVGNSDSKALIFTGAEGVFASGADLREIANVTASGAAEFARRGQDLMTAIANLTVQTIAAVNGVCFGGALDLALACDKRIASPAAIFSHPGATLGIMTGWGGTQRLPRLVGEGIALEMFITAKRVDAAEAMAMGLIDQISDDPVTEAIRSVW